MRTRFLAVITSYGLIASAIATAVIGGERTPEQSSSAPSMASADAPLGEVTITGQRSELEPRVSAFVTEVAGSYYNEGLARWIKPVCPQVTGLTREEDENVLARISEIARAAGTPLAGEKCHANLFILVTDQPAELLRGMENRSHTFRDSPSNLVDAFISTPRAVRVWYDTAEITPEGQPLVEMSFPAVETRPRNAVEEPGASGSGGLSSSNTGGQLVDSNSLKNAAGAANGWSHATRLSFNEISEIYRVIVVIDTAQVQALSAKQVTDYVGMVALAEIKTGAHPADAATILRLFDGTPQQAIPGMSDWDQAFLKSLYSTEQKSKLQRALIAREMVRELVH